MIDIADVRAASQEPPAILGDGVIVTRAFLAQVADELEAGRAAQKQLERPN